MNEIQDEYIVQDWSNFGIDVNTSKVILLNNLSNVKRDGRHCCIFCYKHISSLNRHLLNVHSFRNQIKEIMKYPKNDSSRLQLPKKLRLEGDYKHNAEV